jgi:ATP-binding cassette subfamily C (CFTR/MRP) protein 1
VCSVDVATEQKIMHLVKDRLKGKTVISILHRLEAAMEFDRIMVFEDGEVVHFGTPDEVVRNSELFSGTKLGT